MNYLRVQAGASKLEMVGISHASPSKITVTRRVSDITVDLSEEPTPPSEVSITTAIGDITLRVPDRPGVQIDAQRGVANMHVSDQRRSQTPAQRHDG